MSCYYKCQSCGYQFRYVDLTRREIRCEACGRVQILPEGMDDEEKGNYFNQANEFLRCYEFEMASNEYSRILARYPEDVEALWGSIMTQYGVEYIKENGRNIVTLHRYQRMPLPETLAYKRIMELTDGKDKEHYENAAKEIERIRASIGQGINNIGTRYDVFISFKQTEDDTGKKTEDYQLAYKIHDKLKTAMCSVFFSPVSLHDVMGENFESHIYQALRSARVMILIATQERYVNAVWVKNEWQRFLEFSSDPGADKHIMPVFKKTLDYFPESLRKFQGIDCETVAFEQYICDNVRRIVRNEGARASAGSADGSLKRAWFELEEERFDEAANAFNRARDREPASYEASLGLLLCDLRIKKKDDLGNQVQDYSGNQFFKDAYYYADDKNKEKLKEYLKKSREYANNLRGELQNREIYDNALREKNQIETIADCDRVIHEFEKVSGYQDADAHAEEVREKRKDIKSKWKSKYEEAVIALEDAKTVQELQQIIEALDNLKGYRDVEDKLLPQAEKKLGELENTEKQYCQAVKHFEKEEIEEAKEIFKNIPEYRNSAWYFNMCTNSEYLEKVDCYKKGKRLEILANKESDRNKKLELLSRAMVAFSGAADYKDAKKEYVKHEESHKELSNEIERVRKEQREARFINGIKSILLLGISVVLFPAMCSFFLLKSGTHKSIYDKITSMSLNFNFFLSLGCLVFLITLYMLYGFISNRLHKKYRGNSFYKKYSMGFTVSSTIITLGISMFITRIMGYGFSFMNILIWILLLVPIIIGIVNWQYYEFNDLFDREKDLLRNVAFIGLPILSVGVIGLSFYFIKQWIISSDWKSLGYLALVLVIAAIIRIFLNIAVHEDIEKKIHIAEWVGVLINELAIPIFTIIYVVEVHTKLELPGSAWIIIIPILLVISALQIANLIVITVLYTRGDW